MRRIAVTALAAICALAVGCTSPVAHQSVPGGALAPIEVAALKGPTGMGAVELVRDGGHGRPLGDGLSTTITVSLHGTVDEIAPGLVKGSLDAAFVPANFAAVLYNRTDGAVQVAAVTTLGALYVVERGDGVRGIADLAGRTVVTTGKGTTPQYVSEYLLSQAGIADKVTLDYRSEASEAAAALVSGQADVAILPEPYVSTVLAKDSSSRVALDLTSAWNEAANGSQLVAGVLLVQRAFDSSDGRLGLLLEAYAESAAFVNDQPNEAAALIAEAGIVPDATIALAAIPRAHIVDLTGADAQAALSGYLQVLHKANPESVGGKLPGDDFYYDG